MERTSPPASSTPAYSSWQAMRHRCLDPKARKYEYYGGRGISICERWSKFQNFLADMGPRPPGTQLDRFPNNDGNYEPGNVRWATRVQQRANRRGATAPILNLAPVNLKRCKNLQDQRFGRLTAKRISHSRQSRAVYWECVCDCGGSRLARVDRLTRGEVASCGACLTTEAA